jgi:hypothetical protein
MAGILGRIMGRIMAESWQNHGRIMAESWQNHGRIMGRIAGMAKTVGGIADVFFALKKLCQCTFRLKK